MLKLDIPPLRERQADIDILADRFLQMLNDRSLSSPKTMSEAFLSGLHTYSWPGNIRQLQNSISRAYYTCTSSVLTAEDLEFSLDRSEEVEMPAPASGDFGQGAITAAAERLGISRATLYRRIKQYGINTKAIKKQPF